MKNHRTMALVAVLSLIFSCNSLAGTKIVIQAIEDGQNEADSTMLIQGNKLRMSYFDKSDSSNSDIIFNHQSQSMMAIDTEEKSYMVFEAAHLASVKAKMDAVKQQMEAQLAKMPAEQQKMMREMMAGKLGIGKPKEKPTKKIVKTDNTGSAAGFDCQYVEVYSNDVKKRELCITPWSKLTNGGEVKTAMQGMMSFFEKVMDSVGQFAQDDNMPFSEINELGGFPIIYKEYKNGKITEQSKLKSINDESITEELFNPPKGYKKQSLNDMM
ncbi:MAG: hypothetical protein ABJI60_11655 [Kangiellaceae bacterium]